MPNTNKTAGMSFTGQGEFVEYIPNRWIVINVNGGIKSTIMFSYRTIKDKPNSGKTRIILSIMYKIPVPVLGKLAGIVVRKINENDIELLMNNLSARFLLGY